MPVAPGQSVPAIQSGGNQYCVFVGEALGGKRWCSAPGQDQVSLEDELVTDLTFTRPENAVKPRSGNLENMGCSEFVPACVGKHFFHQHVLHFRH